MAQEGRGGAPSGFIGKHLAGDLHGRRSIDGERGHNGAGAGANGVRPASGKEIDSNAGAGAGTTVDTDSNLYVIRDLKKSGLDTKDISARALGDPERGFCGVSQKAEGYAIPYYDISGDPLPFYRIRILNADYVTAGVRYKQPRRTPNHIYFPRRFRDTLTTYLRRKPYQRLLIITEGEKKAACADKMGFPAVALSGVESWRSRTIVLPEDTEFYSTSSHDSEAGGKGSGGKGGKGVDKGQIRARLPSSDTSVPELITLAQGFGDLIDLITQFDLQPVLIYDSDRLGTLKAEVQRAATMLAYELVYLGIHSNKIKQVILPALKDDDGKPLDQKVGLDDYIMSEGAEKFEQLVVASLKDPRAFPRHPNPKGFISTQLQNKMSRKCMQQVASMILTEIDASGMRLADEFTGQPYYYDSDTFNLMPADMIDQRGSPLFRTPFGTLLYRKFGISANDSRVLGWLAAQFTGEEPITTVIPRRMVSLITEREDALNPYGIAIQVSDSHYLAISPDPENPVTLKTNGSMGILFERDQVEPLDVDLVLEHLEQQLSEAREKNGLLESWWGQILSESNIGLTVDESASEIPDLEGFIDPQIHYTLTQQGKEMRQYASLLFYISPFLLRWRGLQLPIELTVGGPGSGKSSLYSLRLQILTGRPKLRNIPTDIRDWQASLANSGGLHVTDNVQFLNRELRQRMSDELCRITTEPTPTVAMRKLYTETTELIVPIHCAFAFTSIHQPFLNEDLIQRSVMFHTESVGREPKGSWVDDKVQERGGREAWMAHHLAFLHLFLRKPWNDDFRTSHRLAHLEQSLLNASYILEPMSATSSVSSSSLSLQLQPQVVNTVDTNGNITGNTPDSGSASDSGSGSGSGSELGKILAQNQAKQVLESDIVIQALKAYIEVWVPEHKATDRIFAAEISEWCLEDDRFSDHPILNSPIKLGRYLKQRISLVAAVVGIIPAGTYANRTFYRLRVAPNPQPQTSPLPPL